MCLFSLRSFVACCEQRGAAGRPEVDVKVPPPALLPDRGARDLDSHAMGEPTLSSIVDGSLARFKSPVCQVSQYLAYPRTCFVAAASGRSRESHGTLTQSHHRRRNTRRAFVPQLLFLGGWRLRNNGWRWRRRQRCRLATPGRAVAGATEGGLPVAAGRSGGAAEAPQGGGSAGRQTGSRKIE